MKTRNMVKKNVSILLVLSLILSLMFSEGNLVVHAENNIFSGIEDAEIEENVQFKKSETAPEEEYLASRTITSILSGVNDKNETGTLDEENTLNDTEPTDERVTSADATGIVQLTKTKDGYVAEDGEVFNENTQVHDESC